MPLTEPAHLDLLTLLSGGGHPDGITDESLSALILSLRSSYPEEGPPERLPDELLPDEAERQLFLYAEPFIHDRLQRTAARLRSATSTDERAACLGELRDCFALSDRIGRVAGKPEREAGGGLTRQPSAPTKNTTVFGTEHYCVGKPTQ